MRLESYKHRFAKELFAQWLREIAAEANTKEVDSGRAELYPSGLATTNPVACLGDLGWRINRGRPHWGIWIEYPLCPDGGNFSHCWDELDTHWAHKVPTYRELQRAQLRPNAVVDVAIQHKGYILHAVEIAHTSYLTLQKNMILLEYAWLTHTNIWQIPADWVLEQTSRPTSIPLHYLVTSPSNLKL